ncbi:fibronectin type III domain-containing protein [Tenacibaculum jejuense]|uniref:Probable lipoprotein n=1 Tax=Tenacibaculum jejuense TaxID=584609 RepID=A0A238U4D4_9FLAO|nr:fibronectin type III domain-containing protein [Tenacibaculum jejuense]SNR13997.1 Probable lipoprotein precursor [Tenacibaculum jejuense]
MRKIIFFLQLFILSILLSCSNDEELNVPPSSVSGIEAEVISETRVKISWEASEDPNGDDVTYTVIVNGTLIENKTSNTSLELDVTEFLPLSNRQLKEVIARGTGLELSISITAFDSESNVSEETEVKRYVFINRAPGDFDFVQIDFNLFNYDFITLEWSPATDADNDILSYDVFINDDPLVEDYIIGSNNFNSNGSISVNYNFRDLIEDEFIIKIVANDRSGGTKEITRAFNFRATDVDLGTISLPYNESQDYEFSDNETDRKIGYNFTLETATGISITDFTNNKSFILTRKDNNQFINSGGTKLNVESLEPGDYYLEIQEDFRNVQSGTFSLNFRNATETDVNLGVLSSPFSGTESLEVLNSEPDNVIVFEFEAVGTARYTFTTNASVSMTLFDENRNFLNSSFGSNFTGIIRNSQKYFLEIRNQSFSRISESVNINVNPVNIINESENLGTINTPFNRNYEYDTTSSTNGVNRISFNINTNATYTIETIVANYDTFLRLYDSNGVQLNSDDDGGQGALSRIVGSLQPGSYVIEVAGFSGNRGNGVVSVNLN